MPSSMDSLSEFAPAGPLMLFTSERRLGFTVQPLVDQQDGITSRGAKALSILAGATLIAFAVFGLARSPLVAAEDATEIIVPFSISPVLDETATTTATPDRPEDPSAGIRIAPAALPTSTGTVGAPRSGHVQSGEGPSVETKGAAPEPAGPAIPDDARTGALVERVKARWAVKAKRDFDATYEFETPAYRAETPADTFARQFGAMVQWHGIEVIRVTYEPDGRALVDLLLDHTFISPLDDEKIRTKSVLRERWAQVDGRWYHVTRHDAAAIFGGPPPAPTPDPAVAPPEAPSAPEVQTTTTDAPVTDSAAQESFSSTAISTGD